MRPHSGKAKGNINCGALVNAARALIANMGLEPTWDLFSRTLGWHQLKKKLTKTDCREIESIWRSLHTEPINQVEA